MVAPFFCTEGHHGGHLFNDEARPVSASSLD